MTFIFKNLDHLYISPGGVACVPTMEVARHLTCDRDAARVQRCQAHACFVNRKSLTWDKK